MNQLYNTMQEAALAALILLPLLLILNRIRFHSYFRTFLYFLFSLYLAGVYAVVGLPNISYIRFDINLNILPFRDICSDLSGALMNVVLFVPLGFFLSLLWKKYRTVGNAVFFGFCVSLSIELLQIFTLRATDINDLLTNTAGTCVGYCLGMLLSRLFPRVKGYCRNSDLALILFCSGLVMFLFQPIIWMILY